MKSFLSFEGGYLQNSSDFAYSMENGNINANSTLNDTMLGSSRRGATIVSPIIMFMTGLIGNTLALVVLYRTNTEIRRTMFYTLVAGLAWTDITGQILTSPVSILTYINGLKWVGGDQLCKFNGFIMGCFGLSTPCLVCAMAVERFLALKCPYFYSKYCTRSKARATIVILWAIVLFVTIMPLLGFGQYSKQYPGTWCFLNFHTTDPVLSAYGYLYAGLNLIIIVIMTACNIFVMATLLKVRFDRRHSIQHRCHHHDNSSSSDGVQTFCSHVPLRKRKQHAVQMQMIWLMCAITTVFAVCWAPLMIQIVRTLATGKSDHMADLLGVRLASINQILDPWLYILVRRSFIQNICTNFRRHLCSCYSNDTVGQKTRPNMPRVRYYPHNNGNIPELDNGYIAPHVNIQFIADDDIIGIYTVCPHCTSRRRRDLSNNLAVPDSNHLLSNRLPDVMASSDSRHSDHSDLPDVTPEGHAGRAMFSIGSVTSDDAQPHIEDSSGYYDTESEPIYVDVFLLPRDQIQSHSSASVERNNKDKLVEREVSDVSLQSPISIAETSVFMNGTSTSGVVSWNNQSPRRPFKSADVCGHDITQSSEQKQTNDTRRTKSYT